MLVFVSTVTVHGATLPRGTINAPPQAIGNRASIGTNTTLNVLTGGVVGNEFTAELGGVVNISGGVVGEKFTALPGSKVTVSGGTIGERFDSNGAELTVTGGVFGRAFRVYAQPAKISGGSFGFGFNVTGPNAQLEGGDFQLNGAAVTDSALLDFGVNVFSGMLKDGTVFILSAQAGDFLGDAVHGGVKLASAVVPPASATPVTVSTPSSMKGLRQGQTLTLVNGGALSRNFAAVGATLNIAGGDAGEGLEVLNSYVNISGGAVSKYFHAFAGSDVNVTGGIIRGSREVDGFRAYNDSVVNISGGEVGNYFSAEKGSVINVSGGSIGGQFYAQAGSVVNIAGGRLTNSFTALDDSEVHISGGSIGPGFNAAPGSYVTLAGGEFLLNGVAIPAGKFTIQSSDVLTGTLQDGSTFAFVYGSDQLTDVTLMEVPLPARATSPMTLDNSSGPRGLRAGEKLTVVDGGAISGPFTAVDSTLNFAGGVADYGLELVRSQANVSGGAVGGGMLYDSHLSISGGAIGSINAVSNSMVSMSGGALNGRLDAGAGSTINVSGGSVFSGYATSGSVVNFTGGAMEWTFTATGDSRMSISGGTHNSFTVDSGSYLRMTGGQVSSLGSNARTVVEILEGVIDRATFAGKVDISGGSIGLGTQVWSGGVVNATGGTIGSGFRAEDGSIVNFSGANVGANLTANSRSTVNIFAGTVGGRFLANSASKVNISGGLIDADMTASAGSSVTFSGGSIGDRLRVSGGAMTMSGGTLGDGAQVTSPTNTTLGRFKITGGSVGNGFRVQGYFSQPTPTSAPVVGPATVEILGGAFGERFTAGVASIVNISGGIFGESFVAEKGATINLFGRSFAIDGIPMSSLIRDMPFTVSMRDAMLSGVLTDGSPFSFTLASNGSAAERFDPQATLTVTLAVPEPRTLLITALAVVEMVGVFRSQLRYCLQLSN
ncbi:MAG: hypothetical protein C0485_04535 [Pirellula sp.]|nr:hypothetical protein [Pirellula sp.]